MHVVPRGRGRELDAVQEFVESPTGAMHEVAQRHVDVPGLLEGGVARVDDAR